MSNPAGRKATYGENDTTASAQAMVPVILKATGASSVVDVGCNLGHWLSVFLENGAESVRGFDGQWTDTGKLVIPAEAFSAVDINERLPSRTRYDLAVSLETAEHLTPERAPSFIEDLTLLSDIVLFSSAPPGQGGKAHVNEQWPHYLAALFKKHGYRCVDLFRAAFWDDERVFYYYAQNTFLFCSEQALHTHPALRQHYENSYGRMPLSVIHPGLFTRKMQKARERSFPGCLVMALRRIFCGRSEPTAEGLGLPPSARTKI